MRTFSLILCILCLLFSGCSSVHAPPFTPEQKAKFEEERKGWPKTVVEAVTRLLSTMSEEDKQAVRETPEDRLILYHHGWGMGIRNSFGLWAGNRALMKDCKADHPDSASMVIIRAVWARLQEDKTEKPNQTPESTPSSNL